jgi:hypothetical protein
MALNDKQQQPSVGKTIPNPTRAVPPTRTAPPKAVPAPPKDASIFGGRQYVPIREIHNRWRGPSRQVPGTGRLLSEKDRFTLTERLEKNYGSYIKQRDVSKELSRLEREKSGKSPQERQRIDDQIRWLRGELMGPGK